MRSVAPPAVVLALRGVLPRDARPLAPARADSLERPRLLEPESDASGDPTPETRRKKKPAEPRQTRANLQSVSSMSASASLSP